MSDSPTRLYLIRHGQAVVNVTPIIGGMKGDTGLTDRGIQQAERLRDRLKATGEVRAHVVIASTLPRAHQTAEIVAPVWGLPIFPDDEVHELRPGPDGDGLTISEYKKRFGWAPLANDPTRRVDPGGESWVLFVARVCAALERITTTQEGKSIVVFTHGGVIDASFLYFFGMDRKQVPPAGFDTVNTSLTLWERVRHQGAMRWRLNRYNDAAHLGTAFASPENIDYSAVAPTEPAPPTEPTSPVTTP